MTKGQNVIKLTVSTHLYKSMQIIIPTQPDIHIIITSFSHFKIYLFIHLSIYPCTCMYVSTCIYKDNQVNSDKRKLTIST